MRLILLLVLLVLTQNQNCPLSSNERSIAFSGIVITIQDCWQPSPIPLTQLKIWHILWTSTDLFLLSLKCAWVFVDIRTTIRDWCRYKFPLNLSLSTVLSSGLFPMLIVNGSNLIWIILFLPKEKLKLEPFQLLGPSIPMVLSMFSTLLMLPSMLSSKSDHFWLQLIWALKTMVLWTSIMKKHRSKEEMLSLSFLLEAATFTLSLSVLLFLIQALLESFLLMDPLSKTLSLLRLKSAFWAQELLSRSWEFISSVFHLWMLEQTQVWVCLFLSAHRSN